jgi:hypothetical protein
VIARPELPDNAETLFRAVCPGRRGRLPAPAGADAYHSQTQAPGPYCGSVEALLEGSIFMSLRHTARRLSLPALPAAALAAALLAIGPCRAASAGASAGAATAAGGGHSAKPVIVLEHGA